MNAKEEFLEEIKGKTVKCAIISYYREEKNLYLKINYTEEKYQKFLKELNFEYDEGWGSQELFGTIWYKDGTWSFREEYNGTEWWNYNKCPKIINELL